MPIDLTGIQNENEFYSDHYLTTVFEGDIKETVARWNDAKEDGGKAPHQELGGLAPPYIRAATEYRDARDTKDRLQIFRQFAHDLLAVLGYERKLQQPIDANGSWVPALARIARSDGTDLIWIVEALSPAGEDFVTDPLALDISVDLAPPDVDALPDRRQGNYEDAIATGIFGLDHPPRFVLVFSMAQILLIDRNKWAESRLLRFDFAEIFSRKESATLQAVASLLHRESLAPDGGTPLIDTIDEESHRHAHGVSKDLKYALREAIELIGNEAAEQIVAQRKTAGETAYQTREGKSALDANQLSLECLRYMYRLLFLFYIEARPDLGFAPMKSEAYRRGYSLESLRELELMPLTNDEEKEGYFLFESLNLLFRLVYQGTPYSDLSSSEGEYARDFDMLPVKTQLFDPDSTPMLGKVRFTNETLQRVIQLMSLSREGQGKTRRGRISYAQLGINQLGAVYEALLSYSGFFAQEDLYEVKKAGEPNPDPLEAAYFVQKSDIEKYEQDEIVYVGNDPQIYPKGTFIYRLAGRDRENSASYYTPEILTRCLVKYTLKELLKDRTADEILKLTICEPAMGSAAFLVEAVNQLTDVYLARKQEELGERISHDQYAYERQKVRAYITDRNTFGVDLNPIAMELGQVSLWLNCIHEGDFVPWFGDQLFAGNSLIGARCEVYPVSQIGKNTKKEDLWIAHAPRAIKSDAPRKADEVYHFLLPDPGMANYKKSVVEPLAPEQFEKLKEWRKVFCAPLDNEEINQVKRLSAVIDDLYLENARALANERLENNDPLTVWGQPIEVGEVTDFKYKNSRLAYMRGESARNAVPYQRLKTAMDYWCSLWLWPLERTELLPTREEYLFDLTLILEGNILSSGANMFERENLLSGADPNKIDLFDQPASYGQVDIDVLRKKSPRLRIVENVAHSARFFHWPVELGDIFVYGDGFDLVLGNPPWLKPEWNDHAILSEHDATLVIRNVSAAKVEELKPKILYSRIARQSYLDSNSVLEGGKAFLSAAQNYEIVSGQPNLYKCFISKSISLCSKSAYIGLLHSNRHMQDPKGQKLRNLIFRRLCLYFQFQNEFKSKLFSDVANREQYSINIYKGRDEPISFKVINNLFLPQTIDECFAHDGIGEVPGLKNNAEKWEVRGHKDRIIQVDEDVLKAFSSILEGPSALDWDSTRMPSPHSKAVMSVLLKLGNATNRFGGMVKNYLMDSMWHETADVKTTRVIKRDTGFRSRRIEMILSGPNFFVANPMAKTPRAGCKNHRDYETLDLDAIPDDYLPRANYSPNIDISSYREKLPNVPWESSKKHTDFYRIFFRAMTHPSHERTLKGAIFCPDTGHINGVESLSFEKDRDLLTAATLWSSLPHDFLTKVAGNDDVRESFLRTLPWVDPLDTALHRTLQLNCLTKWYSDLWNKNAAELQVDPWSSDDKRLTAEGPHKATRQWTRQCALHTDFVRRQALIEIDILVSIALGLTLDELIQMYRVQFPVMQSYDRDTWYDQQGRIVFSNSKNLTHVGLERKIWEAHKDMTEGVVSKTFMDDTMPDGPVERTVNYQAPFTLPNREEDYERAWSVFYPKYASKATT
jgi:hypothetical protein